MKSQGKRSCLLKKEAEREKVFRSSLLAVARQPQRSRAGAREGIRGHTATTEVDEGSKHVQVHTARAAVTRTRRRRKRKGKTHPSRGSGVHTEQKRGFPKNRRARISPGRTVRRGFPPRLCVCVLRLPRVFATNLERSARSPPRQKSRMQIVNSIGPCVGPVELAARSISRLFFLIVCVSGLRYETAAANMVRRNRQGERKSFCPPKSTTQFPVSVCRRFN